MTKQWSSIREEYGQLGLVEADMDADPVVQFICWFEQYAKLEPKTCNAMVLSTVDHNLHPDSRVVLLKDVLNDEFVFYSHYTSEKGAQINHNPHVALNFYWAQQARQVRVRGVVHRVSAEQSDEYFYSRPRASQLSSIASPQSEVIANRAELEMAYQKVCDRHNHQGIVRPEYWGGYALVPSQIEFWQGRDSRLSDRIRYIRSGVEWMMQRLAP